jgi:hypothetical protein
MHHQKCGGASSVLCAVCCSDIYGCYAAHCFIQPGELLELLCYAPRVGLFYSDKHRPPVWVLEAHISFQENVFRCGLFILWLKNWVWCRFCNLEVGQSAKFSFWNSSYHIHHLMMKWWCKVAFCSSIFTIFLLEGMKKYGHWDVGYGLMMKSNWLKKESWW